ncbi:Rapid ALkalinization Factor [Dillenia turbinata]|uniref:Rapid ALkalinization Factor n=1 Tax=Dillenia turbinata TaxID=194707 RepID=A0AAN8VB48_9MAGN
MAANSRFSLSLLICAILIMLLSITAVDGGAGGFGMGFMMVPKTTSFGCDGDLTVGECVGKEEYEVGDSEISRRIIAGTRRYISYGALGRNSVPCSRRGASYYNCRPGAQANPYTRGCSAITRCRR